MWSPGLWRANGETGPLRIGFSLIMTKRGGSLINGTKKTFSHKELDAMLTTGEVARLLNLHINTVRRWSNIGILRTYRIGARGDRRFERADVTNVLVEQ
jgi:excisionase family DNA binding protein